MFASHAYQWPLVAVTGGAAVASALRYLTLFIGLRLALKGAPEADRLPIFREFARALHPRRHRGAPSTSSSRREDRDAAVSE
jgi:hypothetical protein